MAVSAFASDDLVVGVFVVVVVGALVLAARWRVELRRPPAEMGREPGFPAPREEPVEPLARLRCWFEADQRRHLLVGSSPRLVEADALRIPGGRGLTEGGLPVGWRATLRLARREWRPARIVGTTTGGTAHRPTRHRSGAEEVAEPDSSGGGGFAPEVDTISGIPIAADRVVRVLGPVRFDGFGRRPTDQQGSLITFLVCRGPSTKAGIVEALWRGRRISDSRFANLVSEVRSVIGRDRLVLGADGRYRIVDLRSDVDLLEEAVAALAELDSSDRIARYRSALSLLRGRLFDVPPARHWHWVDDSHDLLCRVDGLVVDAALDLAALALDHEDPTTAEWACLQGLKAIPDDERLVARLADVQRRQGRHRQADRILQARPD